MSTHKWTIMMLLKSHDIHFWAYLSNKTPISSFQG